MPLNPIITTKDIRIKYLEYLKSMFFLKDDEFYRQIEMLLDEKNKFIKGPFIEITPPFVTGDSIDELIVKRILSSEFRKIFRNNRDEESILNRNLYSHQEKAINKLVKQDRNIVVATGTGSGKTECFMIPIIDYLMKQKMENKLQSGVRALLLYPMNALVNDQLKRLRGLLKDYQDITFGRYTGETQEYDSKARELFRKLYPDERILPNEIISREKMRENVPHILITNYAMLEFLLLRPKDNVFFSSDNSDNWKFVVLDEAHSYKGAKGTEISMLLQRLKERVVNGKKGIIKCIATSATLGGGKEDYKEVAEFASNLFHEDFDESDIIESNRINIDCKKNEVNSKDIIFYKRISRLLNINNNDRIKELEKILNDYKISINIDSNDFENIIYNILKNDNLVLQIQKHLLDEPRLLSDLTDRIKKDDEIYKDLHDELLVNVIELASIAKEGKDEMKLLPARYHLFARALEGAFVSFWPKKRIYLDRHKSKLVDGKISKVFELANCQKCGQEYIVGTINESSNILEQSQSKIIIDGKEFDKLDFFIINGSDLTEEIDEDDVVTDSTIKKFVDQPVREYILCCSCGYTRDREQKGEFNCCNNEYSKYIKVWKVLKNKGNLKTCYVCGAHSSDLVKRFLSADDPSTEVLSRILYQNIPRDDVLFEENLNNSSDDIFENDSDNDGDKEKIIESSLNVLEQKEIGRKLLIFSDNRQEAAFFATYLNLKYNQVIWRNAILNILEKYVDIDEIGIDSIANELVNYGNDNEIFDNRLDGIEKKKLVYGYVMKEFIAMEKNTGLEGLGLIRITPRKPVKWGKIPSLMQELNIDQYQLWDVFCVLFDSLRYNSAILFPEYISLENQIFEPRNIKYYFKFQRETNDSRNILGLIPIGNFSNRRVDYIRKILTRNGINKKDLKQKTTFILEQMFSKKFIKYFVDYKYIKEVPCGKEGTLLQINYSMWDIKMVKETENLYRCDKCGLITIHNIHNVCKTYRCNGILRDYRSEKTRFTYFKDIYKTIKPIPMRAEEHTAQLTSLKASDLQTEFEKGNINILSCSTTFEMGVDVGQLESVFMRNMPPETSNYVQRAGRAGRRTSSTAFALTYAKRRSHDLTYFQKPQNIISGKVKAPYIELLNDKITKRHLYSVALAWFFKKHEKYFGKVDDFICYSNENEFSALEILNEELAAKPKDLYNSINMIIPFDIKKILKIENWGWIDGFIGRFGVLTNAVNLMENTLNELNDLKIKNEKEGKRRDHILMSIRTYLERNIITFLATYNVIPKYGFPVDLVELQVLHHGEEARNINLSRDLKMAISEFAPGSEIVAGGRIWQSHSLKRIPKKEWPIVKYGICKKCYKIYTITSVLGKDDNDIVESCCDIEIMDNKYIKPEFGFTTNDEPPKLPTEKRSKKMFPTNVIFDTFKDDEDSRKYVVENKIKIGDFEIEYKYSSRGKLVLVNQGANKMGFRVCNKCGYITNDTGSKKVVYNHKDKLGQKCNCTSLYKVHLGHDFITDVLQIKLPNISDREENLYRSVLYSIIEGAVLELGIARNEISGCIFFTDYNEPNVILYDEVPGGAGHVKKISNNLMKTFEKARDKVSGICGCGEDSSCYGCLQNYGNGIYHDIIKRGLALDYFNKLLKKTSIGDVRERLPL